MSHPRVPLPKPMEILRIVEETVDVIVGAGEEVNYSTIFHVSSNIQARMAVDNIDILCEEMGYDLPSDI